MQPTTVTVIILASAAHTLITVFAAYIACRKYSTREKSLWKLFGLDSFGFVVVLTAIFLIMGEPKNTLELLSRVVYAVVGTFAVLVEIPGYLILSRNDEMEIEQLTKVREALVKTGYSYASLDDLKKRVQTNTRTLEDLNLSDLLGEFVESCERMKNVDRNYWNLVLAEITYRIDDVSKRSKHPVPKLIELLSLAGLSFLIAQFLKMLG
mgnify:CR=1 FL=1